MRTGAVLHNDLDTARSAENLLWWSGYWRRNEIAVSVVSGWVTLSGVVDWEYQKRLAVQVVKDLAGIAGIVDDISIKSDAPPATSVPRDPFARTDDLVSFSRWR